MASEPGAGYRIVDRRAAADDDGSRDETPPGYRLHALLLGHWDEAAARDFLRQKGIHPGMVDRVMREAEGARRRIASLPPFDGAAAVRPIDDPEASAEIGRVLARPEWRATFAPGSFTAAWVEIAKLVPLQAGVDISYAENLDPPLDPARPISAVRLCFPEKPSPDFHVSAEQGQKSVSVSTIHPALEVVGLRCGQQGDDGPLIVSFMVAAPPPMVTVLRLAGRCFLAGGHHRVWRLSQAGFSHAPCIVREIAAPSQLAPAGGGPAFPEAVLLAPRPPLFADFTESHLRVIAPLRAMRRVIRLRPDEYLVPS